MSDLPRRIYSSGLSARAGYLLAFFWSWITVDDKLRGGPHFLYFSIERIGQWRNIGTRAVNSAVAELQAANFLSENVSHHGNRGWWVLTPPGYEDDNQAPDRSIEEATRDSDRRLAERRGSAPRPSELHDRRRGERRSPTPAQDRSFDDDQDGGDRRSNLQRSAIVPVQDRSFDDDQDGGDRRSTLQRSAIMPAQDRSFDDDQDGGDRRSTLQRSAIKIANHKEKHEKHEKHPEHLRKRARSLLPLAADLVRAAPCPPGCAELGTSGHELRCLVALLDQADDEGEAALAVCTELVRGVLSRAPELVKRGQDPKFYAPEMFGGERWSRWVMAFRQLEREAKQAAAEAEAQKAAQAVAAAAAELAQRQQEREAIAGLLADLQRRHETSPPLNPYEQLAARDGIGVFAAQLLRPFESLQAARRVVELAAATGREPSLAEVHAAVAAVLPPPAPTLPAARSAAPTPLPAAAAMPLPAAAAPTPLPEVTRSAAPEVDLTKLELHQLLQLRERLLADIAAAVKVDDNDRARALSHLRLEVNRELARTVQAEGVGLRPIGSFLGEMGDA